MSDSQRIVVAGAGAIGLYVGGHMAAAGCDISFLGRGRLRDEIAAHGLTLTDYSGDFTKVENLRFETDPALLKGADLILVTVKSGATSEMGALIAKHAPSATVVSLQNGISNADTLRAILPDADVRAGMVPFNVVQTAPGTFHRGTSGDLAVEAGPGGVEEILTTANFNCTPEPDIKAVQWGKLLVNLNNALNALSGLTLLEQLQDRAWRNRLAAQMAETLRVLKVAGITPRPFTPVKPALVPHILRLPTPLFRRVASAMLTIDPEARSSMQDDLRMGRKTEIDALQGEVLALAKKHSVPCPEIERVVAEIRQAGGYSGKGSASRT